MRTTSPATETPATQQQNWLLPPCPLHPRKSRPSARTIHTDDYLTGHRDARHAAAELAAAALSAAPAQEPTLSEDDVHTLIGHAIFLRMEGKLDMPAYFFGLATRIAKQIGDAALAARAEELSASPLPQEPQEGKALTDAKIEVLAKESGFGFFGQWLLWQGSTRELLAFARAIERELRGAQEGKAGEDAEEAAAKANRAEAKAARPPSDEEPWVVADDTGLRVTFRTEDAAWRYRNEYTDRLVNPTVTHESATLSASSKGEQR